MMMKKDAIHVTTQRQSLQMYRHLQKNEGIRIYLLTRTELQDRVQYSKVPNLKYCMSPFL